MLIFLFILGLIFGFLIKLIFDYYHEFINNQKKIALDMENILVNWKALQKMKDVN